MPTLNWIGKDKVVNHHLDVPYRTLDTQYTFQSCKQTAGDSAPNMESDNLIIHGDNLEALKALLPHYEGRVKCIYIDPPYNTGNEGWVYNDNVNDPKIKRWLNNVVGKEGEDLSRHDKWLCMMYPRLKLLHKLLAEDGAIFISIDDSEQANLKLVMDEIFGANNFVSTVIWRKNYAPKSSAKYLSEDHEYIIIYTRKLTDWAINLMPRTEKQDKAYKNPDNDPRGLWRPNNLAARNFYSKGTYSIECPGGRIIAGPPPGSYWRVSEEKFWDMNRDNRIWWGKDGNGVPAPKIFLSEVKQGVVPQTFWSYEEVGHTQEAKKEVISILDSQASDSVFSTPKPVRLIERILQLGSKPGDIILDSFAGSGTTAHAVLNLNRQDGGKRKFILVEMEDYAETITAERVRRVMLSNFTPPHQLHIIDDQPETESFSYCTLGESLFDEEGNINPAVPIEKLREYIWFTETRLGGTPQLYKPQSPATHEDAGTSYWLGTCDDTAYYFCYEPEAATTLNLSLLTHIRERAGQYIIYADASTLADTFLQQHRIIFKKIPRDISRL
ncbi:site-specific DNA-methyltransferase (adenine-specific) (plasmid) [Fibrella aestuarina BUZ 2]|uniref:site-specific DNA-methyltransferase (adenine-specific) n=1 Tax=Fibrella aestuarina BUZ 2 TaxID=1166018 RepID=I0KHG4_9BACT|nr:site-specific DNA-methyltransferase [Fibrella aestuarina]CCH03567.1 site-specific DNA-methyltransferase (adenine-specific) [Fibrella aestuarina BUZ 2]